MTYINTEKIEEQTTTETRLPGSGTVTSVDETETTPTDYFKVTDSSSTLSIGTENNTSKTGSFNTGVTDKVEVKNAMIPDTNVSLKYNPKESTQEQTTDAFTKSSNEAAEVETTFAIEESTTVSIAEITLARKDIITSTTAHLPEQSVSFKSTSPSIINTIKENNSKLMPQAEDQIVVTNKTTFIIEEPTTVYISETIVPSKDIIPSISVHSSEQSVPFESTSPIIVTTEENSSVFVPQVENQIVVTNKTAFTVEESATVYFAETTVPSKDISSTTVHLTDQSNISSESTFPSIITTTKKGEFLPQVEDQDTVINKTTFTVEESTTFPIVDMTIPSHDILLTVAHSTERSTSSEPYAPSIVTTTKQNVEFVQPVEDQIFVSNKTGTANEIDQTTEMFSTMTSKINVKQAHNASGFETDQTTMPYEITQKLEPNLTENSTPSITTSYYNTIKTAGNKTSNGDQITTKTVITDEFLTVPTNITDVPIIGTEITMVEHDRSIFPVVSVCDDDIRWIVEIIREFANHSRLLVVVPTLMRRECNCFTLNNQHLMKPLTTTDLSLK